MYVWKSPGVCVCVEVIWCMCEGHLVYVWRSPGVCVKVIWCVCGGHLVCVWWSPGVCVGHLVCVCIITNPFNNSFSQSKESSLSWPHQCQEVFHCSYSLSIVCFVV